MDFKNKIIPEVLKEINDGDTLKLLKECVTNEAMKLVFGYAFIPKGKFLLPDGVPEYKKDAAPINMNPSNLWLEVKYFDKFINSGLKSLVREKLFIQLLEKIHPLEAELVILIKEQNITSVYPNITLDKIVDVGFFVFPHGIDEQEYRAKHAKVELHTGMDVVVEPIVPTKRAYNKKKPLTPNKKPL